MFREEVVGPDVAAFTPMQQAAFANTGQAANAFGVAGGGMTGMEGMPQAQQFDGGVSGYSSYPIYEQARQALQQVNPDQYAAIEGMFNQLGNQPAGSSKGGATAQPVDTGSTGLEASRDRRDSRRERRQDDGPTRPRSREQGGGGGLLSGGGADGVGNFGKVGDYFGGIGDAIGVTDYAGRSN